MELLTTLNIHINSGHIPINLGFEIEATIGISKEHVNQVKTMYQEITNQEIEDFAVSLFLECKSSESCQIVLKLFQDLFNGLFAGENDPSPEYYLNDNLLKFFARTEDEDYQETPKFVPKVFQSGKNIIIQLVPVTTLKEFLKTKLEIFSEDFSEEIAKPQEIKAKLLTEKQSSDILKPNHFFSELFSSFLLDLDLKISKGLKRHLLEFLARRNRKIAFYMFLAELSNSFDLELDLSDINEILNSGSDSSASYELVRRFTRFEDKFVRGKFFTEQLYRNKTSVFMKIIEENTNNRFKVFAAAPNAAGFLVVSAPGYLKFLLREDDELVD